MNWERDSQRDTAADRDCIMSCCKNICFTFTAGVLLYAALAFPFGLRYTFLHNCNIKTQGDVLNVDANGYGNCVVSYRYTDGIEYYDYKKSLQCVTRDGNVYIVYMVDVFIPSNSPNITLCYGYLNHKKHLIYSSQEYVSISVALVLFLTGLIIISTTVLMIFASLVVIARRKLEEDGEDHRTNIV